MNQCKWCLKPFYPDDIRFRISAADTQTIIDYHYPECWRKVYLVQINVYRTPVL